MVRFHDLDVDILPNILSCCDIYTLLSCSQVTSNLWLKAFADSTSLKINKFIRPLALAKPLWLALLLDLSARSLVYVPLRRKFNDYSTDELIAVVKHLVSGPTTWSEKSSLAPMKSGSTSFDGCILPAAGGKIRLLPGGRYFALTHDLGIQCWDAGSGKRIWSRPTCVSDYSVEMMYGGCSAIFFLVPCELLA